MLILTFTSLGLRGQHLIVHGNKALHLYKCNALFFGLLDYNVYLIKYFKCEVLFILGNIGKVIVWNTEAIAILKINSMHETHNCNLSIGRSVFLALSVT